MKQVVKEEIVKKTYYEAVDGTLFTDSNECQKYNNSAKAVLFTRYKPMIIKSMSEYDLFKIGSDDYIIDIIRVNEKEQIDTIMQLCSLIGHCSERYLTESIEKCKKSYRCHEYLFIGRGYDGEDNFIVIDTLSDKLQHIIDMCGAGDKVKFEDSEFLENEIN